MKGTGELSVLQWAMLPQIENVTSNPKNTVEKALVGWVCLYHRSPGESGNLRLDSDSC